MGCTIPFCIPRSSLVWIMFCFSKFEMAKIAVIFLILRECAMRLTNYLLIFLSTLLFACASSEETTKQTEKKEPDIYVFDDVNKHDTTKVENPKQVEAKPEVKSAPVIKDSLTTSTKKFVVQVGAFTTRENAQVFVKENQTKIAYIMIITLRDTDKRFVVRLQPFESREDAEKVRNNIWQISSFKDAFIITLE